MAYQVGLEFIEVNVEGSVKPVEDTKLIKLVLSGSPQGGRDRGDDLSDQAVQVCVRWRCDLEVVLAQIIDRLPLISLILNGSENQVFLRPSFPTWLSTRNAQSQCSRVVCVYSTALYGSTRAVDTWGSGQHLG